MILLMRKDPQKLLLFGVFENHHYFNPMTLNVEYFIYDKELLSIQLLIKNGKYIKYMPLEKVNDCLWSIRIEELCIFTFRIIISKGKAVKRWFNLLYNTFDVSEIEDDFKDGKYPN